MPRGGLEAGEGWAGGRMGIQAEEGSEDAQTEVPLKCCWGCEG